MNIAQLPRELSHPATRISPAVDADERLARLRLSRSENVGPRTFLHLLGRFESAQHALEALPSLAARGGRGRDYNACPKDIASAEIEAGLKAGGRLVTLGDPDYPRALLEIDNPPPVLWIRGEMDILARSSVALVGARNASALGMRTARKIAQGIGQSGRVVVSGLARGIDAAAHEAAIETGTVGVLAGGIDKVYPAENEALAARIVSAGGALVSECAVGVEPTSRHFPRRNRLVSGLAEGVVLIEAAVRSGSLITARFALEQGREVMACPGAPEDPRAGGCNELIREGAALVRSSEDVLEALAAPRALQLSEEGTEFLFDADTFADDMSRDELDALADFDFDETDGESGLSEQIMQLLGPTPIEIDALQRDVGAGNAALSLALLELELAGRIELSQGNTVSRLPEG